MTFDEYMNLDIRTRAAYNKMAYLKYREWADNNTILVALLKAQIRKEIINLWTKYWGYMMYPLFVYKPMKYFRELTTLKQYDVEDDLKNLLTSQNIPYDYTQICLTVRPENPLDLNDGCGSLVYDWDSVSRTKDRDNNNEVINVPKFDIPKREEDFNMLSPILRGSVFEDIYNDLSTQFKVGRFRIMNMRPKSCYSWHRDLNARIHYPIKTNPGAHLIIGDEVCHMQENKWYLAETTVPHTAVNAGKENRTHLVINLL